MKTKGGGGLIFVSSQSGIKGFLKQTAERFCDSKQLHLSHLEIDGKLAALQVENGVDSVVQ